jgi:hypothetical protein
MLHGCFSPRLGEKPCSINEGQMPLNQRVTGSSPVAPTINFLKNHNNLNIRWEPAALHGIFGKLLGTPSNATARRAVLNRAPPFLA